VNASVPSSGQSTAAPDQAYPPSDASVRARSSLRIVVVALLSLWTLFTTMPSAVALWMPQGTVGIHADYDGRIFAVDAGSAAALAGIAPGDRIDLRTTPSAFRLFASPAAPLSSPGGSITLRIVREGTSRTVMLTPALHTLSAGDKLSVLARIVSTLLYVVIGSMLVWLRPSAATWGFFLSCLGINLPSPITLSQLAFPWNALVALGAHLLFAAGATGFLIFALRFPDHDAQGWGAKLQRFVPAIFAVTALLFTYPDVAPVFLGRPAESVEVAALVWGTLIGITVVLALLNTYSHGGPEDRQRIRWVIVGFAFSVIAAAAAGILGYSSLVPVHSSFAMANLFFALTAVEPVTVAYAVIRHRVLDVRFAISRALVYGAITSSAIIIFGIIDWFFSRVLASTRLAMVAEILMSVLLGFALNGVQKRVDSLIDSVFFRARREADRRLTRVAAGLPHANAAAAVDALVIAEPVDAWRLSSGAMFRRGPDGRFARTAAVNWPQDAASDFEADNTLFLQLQGEPGALHIANMRWSDQMLPPAGARPALAVPVTVRHDLVAVALYGAPLSGEAFDQAEIPHTIIWRRQRCGGGSPTSRSGWAREATAPALGEARAKAWSAGAPTSAKAFSAANPSGSRRHLRCEAPPGGTAR